MRFNFIKCLKIKTSIAEYFAKNAANKSEKAADEAGKKEVVMHEAKKPLKNSLELLRELDDGNLALELAPGEENAANIVLVYDLEESIAIQQVFTGTYKYPAQGSITKLVQLEHPPDIGEHSGATRSSKDSAAKIGHGGKHSTGKEPAAIDEENEEDKLGTKGDILRKSIRLIFAGDTKHLGKMHEDQEFMRKYWTK